MDMNLPTNLNDALNLRFGDKTQDKPIYTISGDLSTVGTLNQSIAAPASVSGGLSTSTIILIAVAGIAFWLFFK